MDVWDDISCTSVIIDCLFDVFDAYSESLAEGVMVWSDALFIILRGRSDLHAFQPKATGRQRNNCQTF